MQIPGRDNGFTTTITIQDQTFQVTLFVPSRALAYGAKLLKLVGEPVAGLTQATDQASLMKTLPSAIRTLTHNFDNPETLNFIKELFKCVTVENRSIDFDLFFHGRMGLVFPLLTSICEIQFADFFKGVVSSLQRIMQVAQDQA